MATITLRLKDGDKEGEVSIESPGTLESQRSLSYDEAKALLFEIMDRSSMDAQSALIQMAQRNDSRPLRMTHLGKCLHSYTDKVSGDYDAEFDKGIRELAPDWFV